MPRFFTYMVLLGIVALIAAGAALMRSNPAYSPSYSMGGSPAKPIGNTAISHGGTASAGSEVYAAAEASNSIGIGQEMVIGAPAVLHPAIPDEAMRESASRTTPPVPVGTVVTVVAIAPAVPPDTRQTETYYKVQLLDGQTGWVSEQILRPMNAPGKPPPRP